MRRRDLLLSALLGALARPASAQPSGRTPVVGVLIALSSAPGSVGQARLQGLLKGLAEQGYEVGRDLTIEARWLEGPGVSLQELAHELVQLAPDVIVTHGEAQIQALRRETDEVPIVVAITGDLVSVGHAESIAHPGGNVTGLVDISPELSAKRLQLLTELLPGATRIGVLWDQKNQVKVLDYEVTRDAALNLGKEPVSLPIGGPQDLERAFARARRERIDALVILQDALTVRQAAAIMTLATRDRLPTMGWLEFARFGSLLSYGVDVADAFRQAASFVHRILQGAKPGDLPIEQPTKLQLVVNRKAAAALGITIPQSILLRADEVTE
jgi:putative ABC transport system substrate-binding protein